MKHCACEFRLLSFLIFSFILFSCNKPEEVAKDESPRSFTVSVNDVSFSSATLNWTAATDPEGKEVVYTIELNNQQLASNLQTASFALTNLQKNTAYTGKVTATDPGGNKTSADFAFTTGDVPLDLTLKVDSVSNKSVRVSWVATGTATYDLYKNNVAVTSGLNASYFVFDSLQPQTVYQFKIVAKTSAGKPTEKTIEATTKNNSAPSAFTITKKDQGFSYVYLLCSGSQDADKDALTWFAVVNDVEQSIPSLNNWTTPFQHPVRGLTSGQNYSVALRVKDQFGAEATSNTISFTTYQTPQNPAISASNEGDSVVVQWISNTQDKIDVESSGYYINGEWKGNFSYRSHFSSQKQPDNSILMKLKLDTTLFEDGVEKTIRVALNWGFVNNDYTTNSNTIKFTRHRYEPTTAVVSSVMIKGPGTYPPQWFIYFKNCIMSDYSDWDVIDIHFDNVYISNFVSFGLCDPMKPGYYTGNITADQYTYLKTKNIGYIIIKDAGGLHKLNFSYTTQD